MFVWFHFLGGYKLNTIRELQEIETRLSEKVFVLKKAIQQEKQKLTEQNISVKAVVVRNLENELQLTEEALQNTQDNLKDKEKLINSKEYKDKKKQLEKLSGQAKEGTGKVFQKLQLLLQEIEAVEQLVSEAGKLERELSFENNLLAYSGMRFQQPFSWLYGLKLDIQKQLNNTSLIQEKLEV